MHFWFTLIIGTLTLLSLRVIYSLQGNYSIKRKTDDMVYTFIYRILSLRKTQEQIIKDL